MFVVELFEQKLCGIFELLDNESRLPRSSTQHFTRAVHEAHIDHPCLMVCFISLNGEIQQEQINF